MNSIDIVFSSSQKTKNISNHLFVKRAIRKSCRLAKSKEKQSGDRSQLQKQAALFSDFILKTKIHANLNQSQLRYSNTPTSVLSQRLKIRLSPEKIIKRNSINTSYQNYKQQYDSDNNYEYLMPHANRNYEAVTAQYNQRYFHIKKHKQSEQENLDLFTYDKTENPRCSAANDIKQKMGTQLKIYHRSLNMIGNKNPKRFLSGVKILPSLSKKL